MDLLGTLQVIGTYFVTVVLPPILGEILGVLAILVVGSWVVGLIARGLAGTAPRAHVKPPLRALLDASATAVGWGLITAGAFLAPHLSPIGFSICRNNRLRFAG